MRKNLQRSIEIIFEVEGGISKDPNDPGGWTNYGISWAFVRGLGWSTERHRNITRSEAADLYEKHFWDKCYANILPAGVDLCVFDMAVNSGPSTACRSLQESIGVTADGIIGPITLERIRSLGAHTTVKWFLSHREDFYRRNSLFYLYGKGWTRRLFHVAMAAGVMLSKETASE